MSKMKGKNEQLERENIRNIQKIQELEAHIDTLLQNQKRNEQKIRDQHNVSATKKEKFFPLLWKLCQVLTQF